jgi:hypothetical protein
MATMNNLPIDEALAQALAAEGVDTHLTLMGGTRRTMGRGHCKM